ncbi:HAD family hydrolase [Allokutzneria oryzae]|uniref:HAD family hydrolase n=1 Tax=Allokutzneria oryzae TaxID=1378989 RepID=A0ABV5ZNQ0_9PSEU
MTSLGTALGAKHIVWDWNGTLLNDNDAVLAAVNDVCAGFGRQALTLDEWRGLFSRPLLQCYERVLERPLSLDDWARIDRLYHERYDQLLHTCGLADGVPDLLHEWRDAGRTQSLLSMWFHAQLVPLITEFGLVDLFQRVDGLRTEVGGDSKADHLAHHVEAQRLDPADVVLIGDVVDDAFAAAQVGTRCVLVTTGVMNRASLEATGVPVADSIPEALHLVRPA